MTERMLIGTAEIAFDDTGGSGPPVLLIHAGGFADWYTPLAPVLAERGHRVIRLVRTGYTGAPAPTGLTISDHAGHAATLLRHLDAGPAHVVAHSSGTAIALQLALEHPALVRTLCLSEPPLVDTLLAPEDRPLLAATLGPAIGSAMAATARGDLPAAFDIFMTAVCGPAYRQVMTDTLGAAVAEQAGRGCRYFFTDEMPAFGTWTFGPEVASGLRQPVLLVQGGDSPPPVHRLTARLAGLLPDATVTTIDGADHLLPLTAPEQLGVLIDRFALA
jgi:pimeloyl-ACP methyl ester carboxylesterase